MRSSKAVLRTIDRSAAWQDGYRAWHERWFAGLTWNGVALILLLCALNAFRRKVHEFFLESLDMWLLELLVNFGTGLLMASLITLAVVATYNRVPAIPRFRYPVLVLAIALSATAGEWIKLAVETGGTFTFPDKGYGVKDLMVWIRSDLIRYILLAAVFTSVYVYFRRAEESAAAAHRADHDRAMSDKQLNEARLQVLQAQIEPHFLFNTLATVRRLYRTEPVAAASMLDNLMAYLAVALPQMRANDSTVEREARLAEAYLNIQRIRMGRRLLYEINLPKTLHGAHLPPMMLLTLVENAVKHGLNPLPEGGFICITAQVDGDQLHVRVADSGQGFTKHSGAGTGLANIRARLAAMYGSSARLTIGLNRPRGVTATVALPYLVSGAVATPA